MRIQCRFYSVAYVQMKAFQSHSITRTGGIVPCNWSFVIKSLFFFVYQTHKIRQMKNCGIFDVYINNNFPHHLKKTLRIISVGTKIER